jgi:ubiquinone/menaquinone biosynthesis C-methylase UbiE
MTVFDSFADQYDAWYDNEGKLTFKIELAAFRSLMPLLAKPWLEIGVGSGRFAQALGIEVGIDPSAKLLEIAVNRGIKGYLGTGEDMPFTTGSFGTAFLIFTLCFVGRQAKLFREAGRILKAEGRLVIGTVLRESPLGQHYLKEKAKGHLFYKNAHFLSYEELTEMLQRSSFDIEKTISTLFQGPGKVNAMEFPQEGYHPDAGFTVTVARRKNN